MVDRHACLAARTTPPDRLNRQRRRSAPSLAALLLVWVFPALATWLPRIVFQ